MKNFNHKINWEMKKKFVSMLQHGIDFYVSCKNRIFFFSFHDEEKTQHVVENSLLDENINFSGLNIFIIIV